MWDLLISLPIVARIAVIFSILLLAASLLFTGIFIINRRKKIHLKMGDKVIDLDSDTKPDTEDTLQAGLPPSTVTLVPTKRTCGDCILIIIAEREKYELNIHRFTNRVLKNQMNFVEQKLVEFQTMYINRFLDLLRISRDQLGENDYDMQYRLFYGILRDSLVAVKDEFRRSFKENGFSSIDDAGFTDYVKEKNKNVLSILSQHIRNFYPARSVIVSVESIIDSIERDASIMQEHMFGIYINARQIVNETEKEIEDTRKKFSTWVDDFIK